MFSVSNFPASVDINSATCIFPLFFSFLNFVLQFLSCGTKVPFKNIISLFSVCKFGTFSHLEIRKKFVVLSVQETEKFQILREKDNFCDFVKFCFYEVLTVLVGFYFFYVFSYNILLPRPKSVIACNIWKVNFSPKRSKVAWEYRGEQKNRQISRGSAQMKIPSQFARIFVRHIEKFFNILWKRSKAAWEYRRDHTDHRTGGEKAQ